MVPAALIVEGTNQLDLVKQGMGGKLLFDQLDLSAMYDTTNLYDALSEDAAAEWIYNYFTPTATNLLPPTNDWGQTTIVLPGEPRPTWMPLQTIHFTSYNFISGIGLLPDQPNRLLGQPPTSAGWGLLQRPTGQWANYPFDIYRYDGGNRFGMLPFDIDDWDWSDAESNDLRADFVDFWPTLSHTNIPEWSQYFSNLEILDENPPGSGSWPWNIAARAVGYLKLSSASASHASSPRMPFYNVLTYITNGHPANEVQSRMPVVYTKVNDEQDILLAGKTDCTNSVGAYEMRVGNFYTPELGYHSKATIRSRTYMRRDFDVSDTNGRVCIAGVASMFWKDEDYSPEDSTDQSHDNDMVMIARADGTFASHELGQFPKEWTNERIPNMTDAPPHIYNLGTIGPGDTLYILQQNRNKDHYSALNMGTDYNPYFEKRGSFSYRVLSANKRFVVKVYECHPWLDTWDNEVITLEVDPTETDIHRGDMLEMDYELTSFVTPGVFFTTPNGGTISKVLDSGAMLRWEAHHPEESATNVIEELWLDYSANGLDWTPIATNVPNTGSYWWAIGALPPTSYYVRIHGRATDGMVGWDLTDDPVRISDAPTAPGLTLLCGTGETANLQYAGSAALSWQPTTPGEAWRVDWVKLQYSPDAVVWNDITLGETNSGSYAWDLTGVPSGTYYLRIYGLADDGTIRWDRSEGMITVTNYHFLPIEIGVASGSDAEFFQNGDFYSTNAYDANTMFVRQFPKEFGTNYWTNQLIVVDADDTARRDGLLLSFFPAWNNSPTGSLGMDVSVNTSTGFALVDHCTFLGTHPATAYIPPAYLDTNRALIRMSARETTNDTFVVTWDQIRIYTAPPVQVVLGNDDGSNSEFDPGGGRPYAEIFDANAMDAGLMPREINSTWWTQQVIKVALSEPATHGCLRFAFDTATNSDSGPQTVEYAVRHEGSEVVLGVFTAAAGSVATFDVPSSLLALGPNSVRLQGLGSGAGDTWATWDQILVTSLSTATVPHIVHVAYADGADQWPWAVAETSHYTGAATLWMGARYLNGSGWNLSQSAIYGATAHDANHNNEIVPWGAAGWLNTNVPGRAFRDGSASSLNRAAREMIYWVNNTSAVPSRMPAWLLSGTNWRHKVLRGFETDADPYPEGQASGSPYVLRGLWVDDPLFAGPAHRVYVVGQELEQVHRPSEGSPAWRFFAQAPDSLVAQAQSAIEASTMLLYSSPGNAQIAS